MDIIVIISSTLLCLRVELTFLLDEWWLRRSCHMLLTSPLACRVTHVHCTSIARFLSSASLHLKMNSSAVFTIFVISVTLHAFQTGRSKIR